jgi:hypothetical protein
VESKDGGDVVPREGCGSDGESALVRGRDEIFVEEADSFGWGDDIGGGERSGGDAVHEVVISECSV